MSMCSWTTTGFGVKLDVFDDVSLDSKIRFIKEFLPDTYKEMQEEGEQRIDVDMGNTSDYLDFCNVWINGYEDESCNSGFGALFAEAINENEFAFDVIYCNGLYEDEASILYEDRLPWEMSARVKKMSAEDMRGIFAKYLSFLGIDATVERQSVEFYG